MYLDEEKKRITERINELRNLAKNSGKYNPVTIAKGESVLLENKEEYEALIRMQEIIKRFKELSDNMSVEDSTKMAQEINNKIIANNELSSTERNILFKKLQAVLKKAKKKEYQQKLDEEQIEQLTDLENPEQIEEDKDLGEGKTL